MKTLRPDWTGALLATVTLGELAALYADFLAVSMATALVQLVGDAPAAGKEVYIWTVNDSFSMSNMSGLGVSG